MPAARQQPSVTLIPLGGVAEIGKNMWLVEHEGEILVLDAGLTFPEEDQLGIDIVIPDIEYLIDNRERVRGVVLSHGHEDHVGAVPYLLRQLRVPVYGTRLTLGLLKGKLAEQGVLDRAELHEIRAGQVVTVGSFRVEAIHVNHSIPDSLGLAVHTGAGTILYMTDFKFDQTPIDGAPTDFARLAGLGAEGLLCLLADSTNAERPGVTPSERVVGETLLEVFGKARGRIIVAAFASNLHRIQQVLDAAAHYGRRVAVTGRSMVNSVTVARELGYLRAPDGLFIDIHEVDRHEPHEVVVLTTGSQGEPTAGLTRMGRRDHPGVEIVPGDTVVISAYPIPGNERSVGRTVDNLFRQGAHVVYQPFMAVHASGHASQEELKLLMNLTRPRFFIPIHGEYRMLAQHALLARAVGIPADHILIPEIGDRIVVSEQGLARRGRVPSGQVFVDGLGVGDVGSVVLRDRRLLAQDGILIVVVTLSKQTSEVVAGPDLISRGFVYMRESEQLIEEARERVRSALEELKGREAPEWNVIKARVRESLNTFLYDRTKRRPMILPVIMEV